MAETSFSVQHYSQTVRLDISQIKAEGGPDFPRLIIPIQFEFHPIGDRAIRPFTLLHAKFDLHLLANEPRISETSRFFYARVGHAWSMTPEIDFPLDALRLERIEGVRRGDLKLAVRMTIYSSLSTTLEVTRNGQTIPEEFLSASFETSTASLSFEIPHSHWTKNILPALGWGQVQLVEIPQLHKLIPEEHAKSLNELLEARRYYDAGDPDKSVAHCRSALEPLQKKLPELKTAIESQTEFEWLRDIGTATYNWLDTLQKRTYKLTNKVHHVPSIGHFSRADAEVILLVTTAVVAYVGRMTG